MTPADTHSLRVILDGIQRIREYAPASLGEFLADELTADAVMLRVIVVGEAVHSLSHELRADHPEAPWTKVANMRHIYVGDELVSADAAWAAIHEHLPSLAATATDILDR